MIVAKLDCNRMVVRDEAGKLFIADQRDLSCMAPMDEDSPPKEDSPEPNIFWLRPVGPRKMWSTKVQLQLQEA